MREVLDKGFVELVDTMGDDAAIVEAARVSYGKGTKKVSDDRGLIRYLYRHKHTTPFEMCEMKFCIKQPIFVARQWIRHRTANINEISGRYSIMLDEFHEPVLLRAQSSSNKQGSSEEIVDLDEDKWASFMQTPQDAFDIYNDLVEGHDVAREQARIHLPLSTYTRFYWKIDLHNLLHFLKLRTDPHAQEEIRLFAEAIEDMVRFKFPLAYEAWVDYSKEAHTFSRMEMDILRQLITVNSDAMVAIYDVLDHRDDMSEREKNDFLAAVK